MIGIYHSRDLDGWACGVIMKLAFPDIKLMGHDYGQIFHPLSVNEPCIMADISFPMEIMEQLAKNTGFRLTWIDHHISAIQDYNNYVIGKETFCTTVLQDGIAACEGTWQYLFPNEQMPRAITLLGEYDTWKNGDQQRWENEILPFQLGMKTRCNCPETFPIDVLTSAELVDKIIEEGKTILKYQTQINETHCKRSAFATKFGAYRAICLNTGVYNSDVFKSIYDPAKHDLMMPFSFDGRIWTVSLYTTKDTVDCSLIAKNNGGGGHKKAAGFQTQDIRNVFPQVFYAGSFDCPTTNKPY